MPAVDRLRRALPVWPVPGAPRSWRAALFAADVRDLRSRVRVAVLRGRPSFGSPSPPSARACSIAPTARSSSIRSSDSRSSNAGPSRSAGRRTNHALSGLAPDTLARARQCSRAWSRPALAGLGSLPRNQSYRAGRLTCRTRRSWDLFSDRAACNSCICSGTESFRTLRPPSASSGTPTMDVRSMIYSCCPLRASLHLTRCQFDSGHRYTSPTGSTRVRWTS